MNISIAKKLNFTSDNSEVGFFIKRAVKNPKQLGAVFPSSPYLGRSIAKFIDKDADHPILELGGGTGALTQAMIKSGIDPKRLYVVELDFELYEYLRCKFPHVHIIHGDASKLSECLPQEIQGQIMTTVSGLPLLNMPKYLVAKIIDQTFKVMGKTGCIIQYSYSIKSSFDYKGMGLKKEKLDQVLRNVPPATVWRYTKV